MIQECPITQDSLNRKWVQNLTVHLFVIRILLKLFERISQLGKRIRICDISCSLVLSEDSVLNSDKLFNVWLSNLRGNSALKIRLLFLASTGNCFPGNFRQTSDYKR